MLYLLDSDVVKKICQYELVDELKASLSCELKDFAVLPQLKFQLHCNNPTKALRKLGTVEAVTAATSLIKEAREVEVSAEAATQVLSLSGPDIDSGELTLFAAIASSPEDELISGDKRAFVALSKLEDTDLITPLWARLICLEEAVFGIICSCDFPSVSSKVRARPDADTAISIIFGRTSPNNLEQVRDGLQSYMRSLATDSGNKYLPPDFDAKKTG